MKQQGVFLQALASDATEAVIDVVGVIGWDIAYEGMRAMLKSIPDTVGTVYFDIYSPGGDVWAGNGIVQDIGSMNQRTVARVQVAASMATMIAAACKERVIAANGRWLIHNPWTIEQGDAAAMEKRAIELRACEQEAAQFYASRTGGKPEDMLKLMAEERWLMSEEAKALGFVQAINNPFDVAAFAAVRDEIKAAGKWPMALAEIPEDKPNDAYTAGAESNEGAPSGEAGQPADGTPKAAQTTLKACAATECGSNANGMCSLLSVTMDSEGDCMMCDMADKMSASFKAGIEAGKLSTSSSFSEQVAGLKTRTEASEAEARKFQGQFDKAIADAAKAEKLRAQAMAVLTEQLKAATERCEKFLSGSLSFSAEPASWQEALQMYGGNTETAYLEAAKRFPHLKDKFNRENRRK